MAVNVLDRFEFRSVRVNEAEEVAEIEKICFPPHEVCSKKDMFERVEHAPELFLVAVDKETGTIAGFLNGLATDEEAFRDEFFTDITVHNPEGKNIFLLGLDVRPESVSYTHLKEDGRGSSKSCESRRLCQCRNH